MRSFVWIGLFAPSLVLASSCGVSSIGTARVEATFDSPQCVEDGRDRGSLESYEFDSKYQATERFNGVLIVSIRKHKVSLEETDGLTIRILFDELLETGTLTLNGMGEIRRADETAPLTLPVGLGRSQTNAVLALFDTCPEFPMQEVMTGELRFSDMVLAEDPEDTGRQERLAGTLTATLTRSSAEGPVGGLRAVFDFEPPRRPLAEHE